MSHESLSNPEPEVSQGVEVNLATPKDLEGIMKVHEEVWLTTYPSDDNGISYEAVKARVKDKEGSRLARWTESLAHQDDSSHVWVAREGDQVVGFCHATRDQDSHHIRSIYLLALCQGKGIGSQLITQAISWLGRNRDIILEVVTYNERAIQFYEKHGFVRGRSIEEPSDGSPTWLNMSEIEMRLPAQLKAS